MTEKGSDELLREIDPGADEGMRQRLDEDRERWQDEQQRVDGAYAGDDPGRAHPDPDEAPPADQAHDEFDPLPPA